MKSEKLLDRRLAGSIQEHLGKYPILALTGPRQSGKTTLLKQIVPDYQYVSLEDPNSREYAIEDPVGFLENYKSKVIFDEVQRAPSLFSYIQTIVDQSGEMGQFILSGSQNFLLIEQITQSLAGRVALFKLLPFDFTELENGGILYKEWKKLLITGFYPAIYNRNLNPTIYYSNYLQTYIQRDVSSLLNIHDQKRFSNFLKLCGGRAGQLFNLSNLANESSISQPTARSWLSILESSYIIFFLSPYFENFNKRIVKSPKLYFNDTGLLSYLLGLKNESDIQQNQAGALFENLIVSEINKRNHHQYLQHEFWYWRDSNGREVDLLTKKEGGFHIYEIKSTQTVMPKLFSNLDYFEKIATGQMVTKNLVYGGTENQPRTKYNVFGWKM